MSCVWPMWYMLCMCRAAKLWFLCVRTMLYVLCMCCEGRLWVCYISLWVLQVCVCLSGVCVCYICCVCVLRVACACVMYLCMFFLLCMARRRLNRFILWSSDLIPPPPWCCCCCCLNSVSVVIAASAQLQATSLESCDVTAICVASPTSSSRDAAPPVELMSSLLSHKEKNLSLKFVEFWLWGEDRSCCEWSAIVGSNSRLSLKNCRDSDDLLSWLVCAVEIKCYINHHFKW